MHESQIHLIHGDQFKSRVRESRHYRRSQCVCVHLVLAASEYATAGLTGLKLARLKSVFNRTWKEIRRTCGRGVTMQQMAWK